MLTPFKNPVKSGFWNSPEHVGNQGVIILDYSTKSFGIFQLPQFFPFNLLSIFFAISNTSYL